MKHFIYYNGICLFSEVENVKFLQNFILVLEIQFQTTPSFIWLPRLLKNWSKVCIFVFLLNMKVKKNWQFCWKICPTFNDIKINWKNGFLKMTLQNTI